MKLKDVLGKLAGLDTAKDYDVTITEVATADEVSTVEKPTQENTQSTEQPAQGNSTVEITKSDEIAQLRNEISQLKEINKSLLTHTPVQGEEKTVESMIYGLCVPQREEKK